MPMLFAIALGGALGALGRHFTGILAAQWLGLAFPFGTLAVNVLGSFLMGVLIEVSALAWSPSPELRALIAVGFLGAFTTFSTFSLDVFALVQRGELASAGLYILLSVTLSIAALFAGVFLFRAILA